MARRLAIFGGSGHGKVIADAAETCGWGDIRFFDDAWPKREINGSWRVHGDFAMLLASLKEFDGVVVGIGDNRIRRTKSLALREAGAPVVSIVHAAATVSPYAKLGPGSVVFAKAAVNVDVVAGADTVVNTGATIDHDCILGEAVHISPGAHLAGGVEVGHESWIGIGASVKQKVQIGAHVVIGGGAAVIRNIPDGATAVGVPAVVIRSRAC